MAERPSRSRLTVTVGYSESDRACAFRQPSPLITTVGGGEKYLWTRSQRGSRPPMSAPSQGRRPQKSRKEVFFQLPVLAAVRLLRHARVHDQERAGRGPCLQEPLHGRTTVHARPGRFGLHQISCWSYTRTTRCFVGAHVPDEHGNVHGLGLCRCRCPGRAVEWARPVSPSSEPARRPEAPFCQCRRRPYRSLGRTMSGMFKSAGLNDPLYLNGVDEDAAWTNEGPNSRSGLFSVSWS